MVQTLVEANYIQIMALLKRLFLCLWVPSAA